MSGFGERFSKTAPFQQTGECSLDCETNKGGCLIDDHAEVPDKSHDHS